jgi:hypothetical protein
VWLVDPCVREADGDRQVAVPRTGKPAFRFAGNPFTPHPRSLGETHSQREALSPAGVLASALRGESGARLSAARERLVLPAVLEFVCREAGVVVERQFEASHRGDPCSADVCPYQGKHGCQCDMVMRE